MHSFQHNFDARVCENTEDKLSGLCMHKTHTHMHAHTHAHIYSKKQNKKRAEGGSNQKKKMDVVIMIGASANIPNKICSLKALTRRNTMATDR